MLSSEDRGDTFSAKEPSFLHHFSNLTSQFIKKLIRICNLKERKKSGLNIQKTFLELLDNNLYPNSKFWFDFISF